MIVRWVLLAVCVFAGIARADIEVRVAEFPEDQQDELRAIVAQVEQTCSDVFGVDVASTIDNALIEVHLNRHDYQRADREVAGGAFQNNWSFATSRAMQGHVALQPPLEYSVLADTGVPLQTKIRVANVAVYLCIYRAFDRGSSFPDWLRQGLSGHLGSMALREMGVMGAMAMEPWTSTEIHTLRRLFEDSPRYDIEALLNNETDDIPSGRIGTSRGMFIAWMIELGILDEVLAHADRDGWRDDGVERLRDATLRSITGAGVEDVDKAFRAWVDAFDPEWDEERRSLTTRGDEWYHSAWDGRKAMCWNKQSLGSGEWEISGQLKVFKRENAQMDILLGYTDTGFMTVAMSPSFGLKVFRVTLEDGDREKDTWRRLETKELKSFELNEWTDFKVSKRRNRLIIKINKERPLMLDIGDTNLDGNWGLGCQYRSAGVWRDVEVKVK